MGRGTKPRSITEEINKILTAYTDDLISASFKMVDTYADFCKERVKQDSPVADEVKKEPQGMKTNALVEYALNGKKTKEKKRASPKQFKPGYYRDGWAVRLDRSALRRNQMIYSKVVYNKRQPHLTHLLENGHDLVNSEGKVYGHVDKIPHIVMNGKVWTQACEEAIEKYVRKAKKIKW